MSGSESKVERLADLVTRSAPEDGGRYTHLKNVAVFRASETTGMTHAVDIAGVGVIVQGCKRCYVGRDLYEYVPGTLFVQCYAMPMRCGITEASPERPFLMVGVAEIMERLFEVMVRMDRLDGVAPEPASVSQSALLTMPLTEQLVEAFARLFELLENPRDVEMLGDSVLDEICYRILSHERGNELRALLERRSSIQRISKAVQHIHQNLEHVVSVEELAGLVHMSRTTFYEVFRQALHMSPLQYAKSIKLDRAHTLLREGQNVNEAGYAVGYNSSSQFSREFKRHFGYPPSATV